MCAVVGVSPSLRHAQGEETSCSLAEGNRQQVSHSGHRHRPETAHHPPAIDLLNCCEANTRLGYIVMKNIARIIGERYERARHTLVGEVQSGLRQKDPLA